MSDPSGGLTFSGQKLGKGTGLTFTGLGKNAGSNPGLTFGGSGGSNGGAMDALLAHTGANPTAGKPANGGGGILGFLGRAASGAANAIKGAPTGLFQLGKDIGTAAGRGTENIANDIAYGATLGHLGGMNRGLGGADERPDFSHNGSALGSLIDTRPQALAEAIREYPALEAARGGLAKSGSEIQHPTQFGKDFVADPTGTVLNTLANLALVAGPVAGTLRAPAAFSGADAAAEGGRLGTLADAAEKAGHVAGKVAASPLIPFTNGLGIAGGALADTAVGRAAADSAGKVGDYLRNTDFAQKVAARQAVDPIAVEHLLNDRGEMAKEISRMHDVAAQVTPDPTEQAAAVMMAHGVFGGADAEGNPAALHLAQALNHPAAAAVFDKTWDSAGQDLPGGLKPSAEAARMALHAELGDLPGDQLNRIHAAAEMIRGEAADRQARELKGYGRPQGGALTPAQTVPFPMQSKIEEMTAKEAGLKERTAKTADQLRATAARLADAATREEPVNTGNSGILGVQDQAVKAARMGDKAMEASAAGSDAANRIMGQGVVPEEIGRGPSALDQLLGRQPAEAPATPMDALRQSRERIQAANASGDFSGLTRQEQILARADRAAARGEAAHEELGSRTEKTVDTLTGRGKAAGLVEGQRQGQANLADRLARVAERRAARAAERYDAAVASAADSIKAAPAAYRPALQHTADFLGGLRDEAAKAGEAGDGATAAQLEALSKDLEPLTKLGRFQNSAEQPVHTPGPSSRDINRQVQGRPAFSTNDRAATMRTTGSAKERTSNNAAYTLEAQKQVKLARVAEQARNEFAKGVQDNLAVTADKVIGEHDLKGTKLYEMMQADPKHPFVPWNPAGGVTDTVAPTDVTAKTLWLSKPVYDEVKRYSEGMPKPGAVGRSIDFVTRWAYKNPLQLSPAYMLKRAVGNAFVAGVNGMSVPDIISYGVKAAQAIRADEDPAALRGSILADHSEDTRGQRITRAIQTPAATIDRMTRVMLYLHEMDRNGGNPVEAVRQANRALGSFNSLGPYERDIVRRVFPVYPWMKQVATVAGRLSVEHPAAVVFALHLGDAASQAKWKQPSSFAEQLDPATLFTIQPGDLVNPVVRGGFGAGTGFNLASLKDITRPPNEAQHGPITNPGELAYYLGAQSPLGKLVEQSPLSGVNQENSRFNTGEPRLVKGHTLPAFVPPSHTPLGVFGPYWRQFLGNPRDPAANPQGQVAHQKNVTKAQKTGATYLRQVAALKAAGQNP